MLLLYYIEKKQRNTRLKANKYNKVDTRKIVDDPNL